LVKKKTSIKILDMDEYLGSRFSNQGMAGKEDDLDAILRDTAKMKVRRGKMMELDKYLLQSEQELERLKRGESLNSTGGPLPSNADFLNMAKALENLSPEEAQRVRSSYTFFKMAEKGGSGGMALMPMLLQYAKTNPGASENQMINYLKLMDSQLLKGLEIAKAMNPPKQQGDPMTYMVKGMELMKTATPVKQNDPMEFLKLMKDLVIEGVRNPLMQAIKEAQPTPGLLEQIFLKPELFNQFKEIGIFGGKQGGAGTTEMDLKIAQITTANQLEMKKMDLEWRKSMLERESQDRKTDVLVSALAPFSALLAGPLDQRMRQFGQRQASAHNPAVIPPGTGMPILPPIQIKCYCGYQGSISFDGSPPAVVNCPQCGMGLNVGDGPLAGKPEETDTGVGDVPLAGKTEETDTGT